MSARSCQVTQLAYLSFQDFLETLKEFSLDYVFFSFFNKIRHINIILGNLLLFKG